LSRNDLAHGASIFLYRYGQYAISGNLGQGWMNRMRVWKNDRLKPGRGLRNSSTADKFAR
jgi:hypothetical protein